MSIRLLRLILFVTFLFNAFFGYLFIVNPHAVSGYLNVPVLDTLHLYLFLGIGAFLIALAVGSLLTILNPPKHSSVILILILSYFGFFVVDVVVIARGQFGFAKLLPEMVYYIIFCTLLIRGYPLAVKAKEEDIQQVVLEIPEDVQIGEGQDSEEGEDEKESNESNETNETKE